MSKIPKLGLATVLAASLTASLVAGAQAAPRHAAPDPAHNAKQAACEKVWRAQKIRHGSHEAFVAACVAKG